jgi:hypothetical protein
VAQVELVGSEWVAPAETPEGGESEAPKQTKGVGERLRQVARRIRGDKGGSKARAGRSDARRGTADVDAAQGRRLVARSTASTTQAKGRTSFRPFARTAPRSGRGGAVPLRIPTSRRLEFGFANSGTAPPRLHG